MIVTTFVTAYLFIGAICTAILVSACVVSGRADKAMQGSDEQAFQDERAPRPAKQVAQNPRHTQARPA